MQELNHKEPPYVVYSRHPMLWADDKRSAERLGVPFHAHGEGQECREGWCS